MTNSVSPNENRKPGVFGRLRSWFFTGILVTAPVLLTVYITWAAIQLIDRQVVGLLPMLADWTALQLPGVGLVVGVVLITLIGAVAAGFLGRWIIRLGESLLSRMPVVRTIYGASKQILETIVSSQSDAFREVVLVQYPRRGLWVVGFVTGNTKGEVHRLIKTDMVNVFIPTTPNPTSGFLLFCPRKDMVFMNMSVEEAVKLVVSGGIVTPPDRVASGKSVAKKVPAKGTAAKKTATKRTATEKTAAKKTAAKKAAAKKAVAQKATAKKATAKKATAKKATAKKAG
jgi:uncharacterized membrane protein